MSAAHLDKLARKLFIAGSDQEAFVNALRSPALTSQALMWVHEKPAVLPFTVGEPLSWQPNFVDRVQSGDTVGKHELHDTGAYYCLDLGSIFCSVPLLHVSGGGTVFDMCAAPGGKAIFAWRALRPKLLVCNEAISKRIPALISNLKRCEVQPVIVTGSDSSYFVKQGIGGFDLVLVDAPCSGQSLLAKGEAAPGCFHPSTINKNSNRQKRILANSASMVGSGGYLLYMTCTFSPEENEQVLEWFVKRFPEFVGVEVEALANYRSGMSSLPCYRLFPHTGEGVGGFTALLRRHVDSEDEGGGTVHLERVKVYWNFSSS